MNSDAKITWQPNKVFVLEFSLPWKEVKTSYDAVINDLVKNSELKGFRKGKAPKDLVEKQADQGKVYGEVINRLLPLSYAAAINKHGLKPVVAPKVTIKSAEQGKDWQFSATSCELPEVKLGDYQKIVKGALAKNNLWTPDKGKPDEKPQEMTPTQKLNIIAQALIKEIKIDLPDLLVETERDRLLSRLLDQIQQLGLTIEQYAASNHKTVEQIKTESAVSAASTLKLELILQAVAEDKKFTVKKEEIDKMIAASGDEKIKKQLDSPGERAYIETVLRKRQAIDFLTSLG